MAARAVGAGASFSWLARALDLGRSSPGAIFGGAALLLATMLAGAVAISMLMVLLASLLKADPASSMAVSLVVAIGIALLMATLMVGYLRLIHAVEQGRPVRALDVFSGFSDLPLSGRAVGFMLLLTIAQYVLIISLVAVFAGDFGAWYLDNLKLSMAGQQPAPMTELPDGFWRAFGLVSILGLFFYAVQAIGLGQIANGGRSVADALKDGVAGTLKNLLPFLVFLLMMLAVVIVLLLVVFLLAMIVAMLAKALGVWLVVVIGVPLYLASLLGAMVVMFGIMYFVWRDISGDEAPADVAAGGDSIEV